MFELRHMAALGACFMLVVWNCSFDSHVPARAAESSAAPTPAPLEQGREPCSCLRPVSHSYTGVLMPAQTAEIAAPYAGVVELVHVRIGDRVAAGQVLASLNLHTTHLDRLTAEAAQRGLEAEFRRVKLEAAQTGAHSTRLQQLFAAGLATAEELAQAESLRDISQVRLDEMAARLAEKSTQAEKMRSLEDYGAIRAPFEGSVAARFVDPGAMVAAGTALVRLVSVGDALLRFAVPEADAQAMRVGRNVVATAERGDMGPWQAVIVKAAPEIDAASRLRVVEAKVNAFTGQTDGAVFGSIVAVRLAKPPEPTP